MSYDAKVFNIMIASPNDVAEERKIVREVVNDWNTLHSMTKKIVLLPIGWDSHSSPEMGAAPQEIINNQVSNKGDLLIGVFWTRIGTETTNYVSGTVEEIEKHINAGKPAMLYFSSQEPIPESLDPQQYYELKVFKESCESRGLYWNYCDPEDFREKLSKHLQLKINDHQLFSEVNQIFIGNTKESITKIHFNNLSPQAQNLLKDAAQDKRGIIIFVHTITNSYMRTPSKEIMSTSDRREIALWEAGLNELLDHELIVPKGPDKGLYEISNLGYKVVDMSINKNE